ncbi:hypothetical protein A2165_01990 [Candidatus Curtissbacteria bacterium RBG_13_40_7]|uniref:Glycosyltransferase RgtA/B/C/D-like domain-containing protein n=1 Tax=Candidatus Curtissbacteria bacterium RBG_13_40_7 TaxID=1797706 RepID=A0A1F5FU31_9BACT|nr:MAG: hypothetical protein A2165_01990 [Candidatus Curtissbacteria bacterium RBG_13_40_7]
MKKIFLFFLIWRIGLFLIAFISPLFIPNFGARFPYFEERLVSSGFPHFIWSFGNFDGVHYLGIAQNGYAFQFTQVFFPFYPILIKLLSYLTFGNFLVSGLLISNLAFFGGLVLFFKLVKNVYNEKIAFWSCLFLLTFPTSFYFGAVYTEGLFFLLIISAFYLLYKNKVILASIIGSFASLTRLAGLFLVPSLMLKKDFKSLIPVLIVPLGFLAYVTYLQIEFNNPLYFLSAQSIFGQERSTSGIILLPQVFWRYIKILATTNGLVLANAVFEMLATIFALSLLVIGFNKIKTEWLVFSLIAVLVPTLTGTFTSMPRYILVAFPIYIMLALVKSTIAKSLILFVFFSLLIISTILFAQGYWVA